MRPSDHRGVRSTAAIFGHPIHPVLVVFPIGFLVGAFMTDLAFWGTSDPFWARASEWLLGAGMVVPFGIILSVVVVVIFLVTGWLGGELVCRHRIGMIDGESEALPSAAGAPTTGIDLRHAGGRRTPV
jgi:uncharacterized membrane protein